MNLQNPPTFDDCSSLLQVRISIAFGSGSQRNSFAGSQLQNRIGNRICIRSYSYSRTCGGSGGMALPLAPFGRALLLFAVRDELQRIMIDRVLRGILRIFLKIM